ncbi:uncharacterized protein CELE_C09B7.2 [Caenorhabditis elegans]|nr:Secreted protein [Caenorhabditis elegans]CCD83459.1 Secreted protein [Caenorhabditis elegans]|eukprot:NP_508473.3 Uncharacterized protein CELE_C09B7.2 [Caenorhabditis elegans]
MQLSTTMFLLLIYTFLTTADHHEEEIKLKQVLEDRHFVKMEPSMASKKQFNTFMDLLCISTADMPHSEYMTNYIAWEEVEFMDGIQEFLEPSDLPTGHHPSLYHHLGHNFASNCTLKDEKYIRQAHDVIDDHTKFDNYMYDQMTRKEWTDLNL